MIEPGGAFGTYLGPAVNISSRQTRQPRNYFLDDSCHLPINALRIEQQCAVVAYRYASFWRWGRCDRWKFASPLFEPLSITAEHVARSRFRHLASRCHS